MLKRPLLIALLLSCSCGDSTDSDDTQTSTQHDAGVVGSGGFTDAGSAGVGGDGGDGGNGGGYTSAPLGTATVAGTCDPVSGPGTTCTRLTIACPDVADLGVNVRITTPDMAPLGVIVLGSGGDGHYYFDDSAFQPPPAVLAAELAAAGFIVVQRAWDMPGWFEGSAGVYASSCRYATLLAWIDQTRSRPSAPLCALGLSGGAIELGYALARWDAADRLRGAILGAGPSMSQLDVVCPSVAPSTWLDSGCRALATKYGLACADHLYCVLQAADEVVDTAWMPNHPCSMAAEGNASLLADDGIVSPKSRYAYPATKVRFVSGADECGASTLLYYDAITTDRALALPEGTEHDVLATEAGFEAIRTAIKESCAEY